jgi:hypothetical protein
MSDSLINPQENISSPSTDSTESLQTDDLKNKKIPKPSYLDKTAAHMVMHIAENMAKKFMSKNQTMINKQADELAQNIKNPPSESFIQAQLDAREKIIKIILQANLTISDSLTKMFDTAGTSGVKIVDKAFPFNIFSQFAATLKDLTKSAKELDTSLQSQLQVIDNKSKPLQKIKQDGGSISNKKNIQSLKQKYLFNQKTLKIKNRLHKLLLS